MATTSAIRDNVYKKVEAALASTKVKNSYKKVLSDFINERGEYLNDNIPGNKMVFGESDINKYFEAMGINKNDVTEAVSKTYYGPVKAFNPIAAKDEFTVTQLSVVKYYFEKRLTKDLELAMIYLAFSGKFYTSIHYKFFNIEPNRLVMEYVVNNRLSNKFDLAATGSVLGAVTSICQTWIKTYASKFKRFNDEDVVYVIQQLHSRIGSFIKNVAHEYYDEYNEGKSMMTYDSDSYEQDDYHIADNDSLKLQRIVEKASNRLNSSGVDYRICRMCADENIRPNEVKSIIESIISNPDNNMAMRELINLLVTTYYNNYSGRDKDVRDISFITYSISAKPNAKQKEILRQKEIVENFLLENSTAYARRRSRTATRNSYERAVLMYFVIMIHDANRN